ncbi:MAG: hypothetical protein MI919_23425, partial [Holophagales bacterium]|nr:hypothetical protein [Holophagales bacterium]
RRGAEQPEESWQWLSWMGRSLVLEARFALDTVSFPTQLTHGQERLLEVEGWVASNPQVREVRLEVGDLRIHAACDRRRNDVDASLPEYSDQPKGFRLAFDLSTIAPGSYSIRWSAPGTGLEKSLGTVEVSPRCEFLLEHADFARAVSPRGVLPFALAGRLTVSSPLSNATATWNGEAIQEPSTSDALIREDGLRDYEIRLHGLLDAPPGRSNHQLELAFATEAGDRGYWRHQPILQTTGTAPCRIGVREIGPWDPHHGTTPVHLRGMLYDGSPGARIELRADGDPVLHQNLGRISDAGSVHRSAEASEGPTTLRFELRGDVRNLPPGPYGFELRVCHPGGSVDLLDSWKQEIVMARPEIQVDSLVARPIEGIAGRFALQISGWVRNHQLTRFVEVEIDGKREQRLGLMVPRPDAARYLAEGLVRRRGFHTEILLSHDPGQHTVRLIAVQDHGEWTDWRGQIFLEAAPQRSFMLESPVIE